MATLNATLPELFDEFTDSNDVRTHLIACSTAPIALYYGHMLASSFERKSNLFIKNESEIYTTIERFIQTNEIQCAERFIRQVIITHFQIIPHPNELIQMCIRLCEKVPIDSRPSFCHEIMNPISHEFSSQKYPRTLSSLLFDLVVAITRLTTPKALPCAERILGKSDFYSWKDLNSSIAKLIEACVHYDEIVDPTSSLQLDTLEKIVSLIGERAKVTTSIYRATHEIALKTVFRWLDINNTQTGEPFSRHVFSMGRVMTNLIDPKQTKLEVCTRFLEILKNRTEDETIEMDVYYENFIHVRNCLFIVDSIIASLCLFSRWL